MKLKLSSLLFLGILLQIISTQGIMTFNFFKLFGHWELKSVLHPFAVLIILGYFILKVFHRRKIKISIIDVLLFLYLGLSVIMLIINANGLKSAYIAFREVFLLFIMVFIYSQECIDIVKWRNLLKIIFYLTLINLFFIGLTYLLGAKEYMLLVTGNFHWPLDPEYLFKISTFSVFWRSPALMGSAGAAGYFGLISYFLFQQDEVYKKKRWFPLLLVILSFIRSAYLALVIYLLLDFFSKNKNWVKLKNMLPYILPVSALIIFPLFKYNILSMASIGFRINHWINDIDTNFNFLFGGALGKIGGAARGEGFVETLDSYWLLLLMSVGFIGVLLSLLFIYEKAIKNRQILFFTIAFFIAGFFITLTQSIPFLVLFPLLFLEISHDEKKILESSNLKQDNAG